MFGRAAIASGLALGLSCSAPCDTAPAAPEMTLCQLNGSEVQPGVGFELRVMQVDRPLASCEVHVDGGVIDLVLTTCAATPPPFGPRGYPVVRVICALPPLDAGTYAITSPAMNFTVPSNAFSACE